METGNPAKKKLDTRPGRQFVIASRNVRLRHLWLAPSRRSIPPLSSSSARRRADRTATGCSRQHEHANRGGLLAPVRYPEGDSALSGARVGHLDMRWKADILCVRRAPRPREEVLAFNGKLFSPMQTQHVSHTIFRRQLSRSVTR